MLTLLMMEERQNRRFERFRIETGDSGPEGGGGADRVASPCLEFLLEERVVKLLCEMGAADRPPGIMSLALGAMAVLLGEVSWKAFFAFSNPGGILRYLVFLC